jgi:hypothetical protein
VLAWLFTLLTSAKSQAAIKRFVKVTFFGALAFIVTATASFVTNNTLGLPADMQTFVTMLLVPIFAAAEKWLNWQTIQP